MISEPTARPGFGRSASQRLLPSGFTVPQWAISAGAPLIGLAGMGAFWAFISAFIAADLPGPLATWTVFRDLVSNPFYDAGPNDKGIGIQLLASLKRVAFGFTLGSFIAVPLGLLIGVNPVLRKVLNPVIQLMRPVSPLAWFPIGLVIFQSTSEATIFIISITSLWPTVINTAFGASTVPQAHRNVARVFEFTRLQYYLKVVLPYSFPHMLTGMRLSMGIAWMVIVAGEMLSGGTGIGFFVWDSWNALSLERVITAIALIGLVGLALDQAFAWIVSRFSYVESV